jgi:hypothetical protein
MKAETILATAITTAETSVSKLQDENVSDGGKKWKLVFIGRNFNTFSSSSDI